MPSIRTCILCRLGAEPSRCWGISASTEKNLRYGKYSGHQLRALVFTMDGREYQAIEQNAEKPSQGDF